MTSHMSILQANIKDIKKGIRYSREIETLRDEIHMNLKIQPSQYNHKELKNKQNIEGFGYQKSASHLNEKCYKQKIKKIIITTTEET